MKKIFQLPQQKIAAWLDRTAMYRVVTLALASLAAISVGCGFLGILPYTGLEQLASLVTVLATALVANYIASKLLRIHVHYESTIISALIIFFLVLPPFLDDWGERGILILVVLLAVSSKFVFVWRRQHLANPAAMGGVLAMVACAIFPFLGSYYPSWWIGTPVLFIPLIVIGALVATKIRKWPLVVTFLGVGFVAYLFAGWWGGEVVLEIAPLYWLSGPSLFLAFFMLTEPFTMPPTRRLQITYAAIVATLAQTAVFSGLFTMTPEVALVLGNLLFYPATLRRKLILPLEGVRLLAERTYEFTFSKPSGMRFKAGQYLEWMLPHTKADSRGVRRYFTIASAPTEDTLRLAVRIPEKMSTYKQALLAMKPGQTVTASQLAGDFTLPHSVVGKSPSVTKCKLGFIAGGIGITPFRSHLQYIVDSGVMHNTVLFYCNNTVAEIAYRDEFNEVTKKMPLTLVHVLAKELPVGAEFENGYVTADIITRRAPDFLERTWYLSGPPGMVNAYTKLLREMGVGKAMIVKDFFPGLA